MQLWECLATLPDRKVLAALTLPGTSRSKGRKERPGVLVFDGFEIRKRKELLGFGATGQARLACIGHPSIETRKRRRRQEQRSERQRKETQKLRKAQANEQRKNAFLSGAWS